MGVVSRLEHPLRQALELPARRGGYLANPDQHHRRLAESPSRGHHVETLSLGGSRPARCAERSPGAAPLRDHGSRSGACRPDYGPRLRRDLQADRRSDTDSADRRDRRAAVRREHRRRGPGRAIVIDATTFGHPVRSLRDIPAGDYWVQPFVNVYTKFARADGHTVWLHMDQWEGQNWKRSPGNLYGDPVKVHVRSRSRRRRSRSSPTR